MNLPFIHTGVCDDETSGWKPHRELEDPPLGCHCMVPVSPDGEFFPQYIVSFTRYEGGGVWGEKIDVVANYVSTTNEIELKVEGIKLVFRQVTRSRWRYGGKLNHPDFAFKFAQFEEPPEIEKLFVNNKGLIFVGCDPWDNYT